MSRHAPHVVGLVVTGYIRHIFQYTPSKSTKIHCCKLFFNPLAAVKYYFGEQTIETIQHQSLSPSRPGRSHPDSLTLQPSLGLHLRGRSVSTIFGTKTCRKKNRLVKHQETRRFPWFHRPIGWPNFCGNRTIWRGLSRTTAAKMESPGIPAIEFIGIAQLP